MLDPKNGLFILVCIGMAAAESTSPGKLTVSTVIETPYVFWRADSPSHQNTPPEQLQGNKRFDGFLVELLDKIAEKANFTYALQLAKDGQYGWVDEEGQWKGMIGELVRKEVDLALAPLTIMDQRTAVVDFTVPFMEFGVSILSKKPQNGGQIPYNNFEELANQTEVDYGVIGGGSTFHFFRTSETDPFEKMWQRMHAHPYVFAGSFFEALDRVRHGNGKYAAILETPVIEFASNHFPCDTMRVGPDEFDVRGYGIALQKGSQWTERLSRAINELKKDGTIAQMKATWWSGPCLAQAELPLPANSTESTTA